MEESSFSWENVQADCSQLMYSRNQNARSLNLLGFPIKLVH